MSFDRRRDLLLLLASVLVCCVFNQSSAAQNYLYDTGNPTYGVNYPVRNGYVNVANGNVHLEVPLGSFTQRGNLPPLTINLVYDSRIWRINYDGSTYSWQPNNIPGSMAGWRVWVGAGGYSYQSSLATLCSVQYDNFAFNDNHGTPHEFPFKTLEYPSGCSGTSTPTASGYATDGSGYYAKVTNYTNASIFDSNGVEVFSYDGSNPYTGEEDSNGNFITVAGSGTQNDLVITDTVNRSPVTVTTSGNTMQLGILKLGGGYNNFTVTTEPLSVNTAFGEEDVQEFTGTLTGIQSIELPDGSSYQFSYDANESFPGEYGELEGMNSPQSSSSVGFDNVFVWGSFFDSYENVNRWVTEVDGPSYATFAPKVVTQCTSSGSTEVGCQEQMTVTRDSGDATVYTLTLNNGAWNTQTDLYSGSVTSGTKKLTTVTDYNFTNSCDPAICAGAEWVQASSSTVMLDDTGQTAHTLYTFAQPWIGKPSKVQQWDYTTGTPGATPTRETDYAYGYTVNGAALLTQQNTYFNGQAFGQTVYNYDQTAPTPTSGLPQHQAVTGARGNLTSITGGLPGGPQATTTLTYDDAGMLLSLKDANLNTTSYAFMCDDTYSSQITYPATSGFNHITKSSEDCDTGSILTATDQNSNVTTYGYDSLGRPGSISYPDGGQTSYSYPSPTETTLTKLINASTSSVQSTTLDEFGRPSQILQSDPAGNDAVTYTYDENGRLSCITNPERSTTSSTDGKTCRSYDFLDRPVYVTQADGNKMQFNYSGNQTNVTDENGHLRSYQYDAFHDLTATWEPDTTGALNWETLYGYDGASRLTSITQNGSNAAAARTRSFTYDSLGRMTGKTSPEAGTTSYTYDSNGNAITVKDARGITVTSSYDALNRITGKSSSDGSVGYGYTYDASAVGTGGGFPSKNPIGRLVEEANAAGPASNQYSYDSMGRIAVQANTLPSNCCSAATQTTNELHFAYDLAGDVSSVTYPDGRAVTYSYDSADHMTGVEYASWNGQAVNTPYLSDLSFEPTGQISAATFGNGVQLAAGFGPRQTVASLQYKNSSQTLWSKQYTWAANAQNLTQIVDATSSPQTYNYAYDPDNRLISAVGGGQTLVSPATSGRGSVSISGTEGSALYTPPGCKERSCTSTVYNSGTVTLTVGNYSYSVDYGEGSTSTSVASALAAKISSTTNSPVAESYSGTTITLTATATGAATNYSLTTSATYDSTFFSSSSFTGTTSGAALTGGANAVYNGAAVLNETYTPDAWGNLQQSGNFSFIQGFGGNNQVSATGYNYDAAGNLLHDGLNNTYSYDGEGKLVSSSGATYVYDALGQRIKKVSGGSTTEYIYVNGQPIALLNPSTGAWTDLILGSGTILAEVAVSQTAAPLYRLSDHLGSVVVEANAAGSAVGSYLYTPYGQLMASSLSDPYAFTGLEQDIENGSDHAWARNYTLSQSRWMRPDPYDGSYDLMNPQSFNRYSYVNGNPLAFTDPMGLDGGPGGFGGIGSVGGCIGAAASEGANVYADIGCGLSVIYDLFGLGGPTFHGSLSPRPSASGSTGPWNDSFGIPNPGLAGSISQAAGLPGEGCEFGACGTGPSSLTPGQTASLAGPILIPPSWLLSVVNLFHFPYADSSDPNHRFYGTHYCGPGGGGAPTGGLDQLCAAHDACYRANGVSAIDNLNPFTSGSAMGGCDRLLCTELGNYSPTSRQEAVGKGQIQQIFGCGYINK